MQTTPAPTSQTSAQDFEAQIRAVAASLGLEAAISRVQARLIHVMYHEILPGEPLDGPHWQEADTVMELLGTLKRDLRMEKWAARRAREAAALASTRPTS
jgi:hypothetical protein